MLENYKHVLNIHKYVSNNCKDIPPWSTIHPSSGRPLTVHPESEVATEQATEPKYAEYAGLEMTD
jgi:hypothetical protein